MILIRYYYLVSTNQGNEEHLGYFRLSFCPDCNTDSGKIDIEESTTNYFFEKPKHILAKLFW